MIIIDTRSVAILLTFIAMLGWGSWANTTKLVDNKKWPFQLFYWDYAIGMVLFSLLVGFTAGSSGNMGQPFITNLLSANSSMIISALIGGVVFNIGNILLVAGINLAGMAVAFPVGVGLALVIGVISQYIVAPHGNVLLLTIGVILVTLAIIFMGIANGRLKNDVLNKKKGLIVSILAGCIMGWFGAFMVKSISPNLESIIPGTLTPYSALFIFALSVFLSNFILNTIVMKKPFTGNPVKGSQYFTGTPREHIVGWIGGAIWTLAYGLVLICGDKAGYAISYALGQCAAMVALIWGVFIWKEFKDAPPGTNKLIAIVFITFILGIVAVIMATS